ncbi:MAG: hypothetical protein QOD41_1716 [Cryptosporangiaceae bacterium]|nr:hypothetical protein [Cryptosporangiaceae bacterium]
MAWGQRALYREYRAAWEAQQWHAAAVALERYLAQDPDGRNAEALWFNAALAHKFLRDWPKAYELGIEAAARAKRGIGDPAFWNLGIAATALGEWATARDAWAGFGIDVPPGNGEIEADLGMTPVRLDPSGEVVWGRRLCPARVRVLSVPILQARRFGEVVLHDGVPSGERVSNGHTYPVFDELKLLRRSELPSLTVVVEAPTEDDMDALTDSFADAGFGAESQRNVRILCRRCSEGSVHHTAHDAEGGVGVGVGVGQTFWLAAPEPDAIRLLEAWSAANPTRHWTALEPATYPP